MRGRCKNGRYEYIHAERCQAGNVRAYNAEALEATVDKLLGGLSVPADLKEEIRAEALTKQLNSDDRDVLLGRLRDVEGKRRRLQELYVEGDIDKDTYRKQQAALEDQAADLKRMHGAGLRALDNVLEPRLPVSVILLPAARPSNERQPWMPCSRPLRWISRERSRGAHTTALGRPAVRSLGNKRPHLSGGADFKPGT